MQNYAIWQTNSEWYNNILTKDETEKQFGLQIVTENRKTYPTATKSSLMKK